jgi:hypothetical protein
VRSALHAGSLLIAATAACAGRRQDLVGFPIGHAATAQEAADRLQIGIQEIEAALDREPAQRSGAGAASRPAAPSADIQTIASRRLLDTYLALAADEIGVQTGFLPFNYPERRQPLFMYPRITFPHIAEAVRTASGEGSDGQEYSWVVPALANRAALGKIEAYASLLGSALAAGVRAVDKPEISGDYEDVYVRMQATFHVALVPRGEALETEIALDDGRARWISPREVVIGGKGHPIFEHPFKLPLGRPDAIDLVFELPVSSVAPRWERKQKETGRPVEGEIFDLRIFPRIPIETVLPEENWGRIVGFLRAGRWIDAYKVLEGIDARLAKGDPQARLEILAISGEARALGAGIREMGNKLSWFRDGLAPIARRLDLLADAVAATDPDSEILLRIRDLEMAIGKFLKDDPSPAPVFLDEPNPKDRSFSFIVGADLHYDTDASCLQQFLAMVDEEPIGDGAPESAPTQFQKPSERVGAAKFVVIVGDFGDGMGLSTSPAAPISDALGLGTPTSPYTEHATTPRRGEFPELREMLHRSKHPFFVVPGNHDGFVNYGGVLNQVTLFIGRALQAIPLIGFLGDPLVSVSDDLPILVKIWRISPPFYDGLVDWSLELGPRNLAFHYRGFGFVALNSFDLNQFARDQVAALANNWGGGLQESSLVWADASLRYFARLDRVARGLDAASGTSFLFLHHDPRAGIASKNGYVEKDFGHYNDVTAPVNELTFGYLGTSSAVYTQIWIPILTPIATGALRAATHGENFQERWMRENAWDSSCYNAEGLLDAINRNLDGAPDILNASSGASYPSARISHLFFGHDDVPVKAPWVHSNGNAVFPDQPSDAAWDSLGHLAGGMFFRLQSETAPDWARTMHFDDGRQATVVRLDDIGDAFSNVNTHGFSLVTVHLPGPDSQPASRPSKPSIDVRRIPIPR